MSDDRWALLFTSAASIRLLPKRPHGVTFPLPKVATVIPVLLVSLRVSFIYKKPCSCVLLVSWVAQNPTKSGTKKAAQSRPSSILCRFLVRQVTPALSLLCHEFSGFSRKNWVIFPKFQLKSSILPKKGKKYPPLTPI
jgi:hypothetical protein